MKKLTKIAAYADMERSRIINFYEMEDGRIRRQVCFGKHLERKENHTISHGLMESELIGIRKHPMKFMLDV